MILTRVNLGGLCARGIEGVLNRKKQSARALGRARYDVGIVRNAVRLTAGGDGDGLVENLRFGFADVGRKQTFEIICPGVLAIPSRRNFGVAA